MKKLTSSLLALSLLATVVMSIAAGPATAAGKCGTTTSPATDWPSYGHDVTNSRNQEKSSITPENVDQLKGAWAISSTADGGVGGFQATPAIVGGCVFAATTSGSIFAVDAKTGDVVWQIFEQSDGGLAGGIFSPAVANGVLYASVGRSGAPKVIALDAATGDEIWRADLYQGLADAETHAQNVNSSMVFFDGLLFIGLAGADSSNLSHPSFFILDAEDGSVVKKTIVIPQDQWLDGYAGGGIWGTGVVDQQTRTLYVGTSNPYNKRREHKHTNAILKIDFDRNSKTFGEILDAYRGDKDYDPKLYNTPQCKYLGELQPAGFSTFCGQRDVDFGASPSLFKNSAGKSIVVNLQKSCTVHAIYADTMEKFWKRSEIGPGGASGCASTTAYDANAVYVNINEGVMWALDRETGETLWKTSYKDPGSHYQPVTVANGVVYTTGITGYIYALDAKTGKVLLHEQMKADGETCAGTTSAGIAVVGDTVYAECDTVEGDGAALSIVTVGGGGVFAYRLK
ncbi:MAG: hypothetical protein QOG04_1905 [Actinomycetota bacterium]|jgi:polyvinyl alcohol dehydrogenase (cytochrome)|nr:hypothetical protein [Actinomycetota bacterium]